MDSARLPKGLSTAEMPADITDLTASQLSAATRECQISCVEVMQAYLGRIARHNATYNAIVSMLDEDELVREARRADQALTKKEYRGWMHGLPHAVKDLANARGLETSLGSPLFAGTVAHEDDVHIARIRADGAIFIGKTNIPEFGLGSQTYNAVHGTTKCAYDSALTSGGSSGGAACAVATHMLPVADGSDMMGSLRNPAAFNNIVGFRPSVGRIPRTPINGVFDSELSTAGPLGRTVEDTVRLLRTMAGFDARDPLSRSDAISSFDAFAAAELTGYRIGWLGNYDGYLEMETGIMTLCESALSSLGVHGAAVEDCRPDYDMARLWQAWLVLRQWALSSLKELYENAASRAQLGAALTWELENGLDLTDEHITAAEHAKADWSAALNDAFEHCDILALPAAQVFPFDAEIHWPKAINEKAMDTYHRWMEVTIGASMAGIPVVNLPCGFDSQGRPMGLQFMGRIGEDQQVLEFAMAYEAGTQYLDGDR